MHGAADGISDPAGSRQLYELAQSKDKLLKLYAGLKHEIMNEPEQAQVLADICDWLDATARDAAALQASIAPHYPLTKSCPRSI